MRLLIDIGNSRVKWALHNGIDWCGGGVVGHEDVNPLTQQWGSFPLSSAYAVNVASEDIREKIEQTVPCPIRWIMAERQRDDIINHYHDVAEQGADRWLAVVAARNRYRGDLIVGCAGTALTIESLTEQGDYLGGSILPGYRLMLSSLAKGTARLNRQVTEEGRGFPQTTGEAIASGIIDGLAGAIERACLRLSQYTGRALPRIVLTGGDATRIAAHLAMDVDIVDNLVLEGLLKVASGS